MSHDPVLPDLGQLPADYFVGGQHITDKVLARLFAQRDDYVRTRHVPVVSGSPTSTSPGQQPAIVVSNSLLLFAFTPNSDDAIARFKIPAYFVGNAAAHVHWSKTSDAGQAGNAARFRLSYSVFAGDGGIGNGAPTVIESEGVYLAADTTDRVIYRTPDLPLVGLTLGHYMSMRIETITPVGSALTVDPGIFSVDLTFDELINR